MDIVIIWFIPHFEERKDVPVNMPQDGMATMAGGCRRALKAHWWGKWMGTWWRRQTDIYEGRPWPGMPDNSGGGQAGHSSRYKPDDCDERL